MGKPESSPAIPALPAPPTPGHALSQMQVQMAFWLTHEQICCGFNGIGSLAEKAGTVDVAVDAEVKEGFDPVWLHNAILDPLEEADIEVEREENGQN